MRARQRRSPRHAWSPDHNAVLPGRLAYCHTRAAACHARAAGACVANTEGGGVVASAGPLDTPRLLALTQPPATAACAVPARQPSAAADQQQPILSSLRETHDGRAVEEMNRRFTFAAEAPQSAAAALEPEAQASSPTPSHRPPRSRQQRAMQPEGPAAIRRRAAAARARRQPAQRVERRYRWEARVEQAAPPAV